MHVESKRRDILQERAQGKDKTLQHKQMQFHKIPSILVAAQMAETKLLTFYKHQKHKYSLYRFWPPRTNKKNHQKHIPPNLYNI